MPVISVLDQSIAVAGRPQETAIRETLALARHCDALGYARFWVSEHHNHPSILGSAPEILVAAMAATTTRIRIGPAGIMLPHYSPLKVAEQFRVIEALAPGRVDLGLGRAPGSDGQTAYALNPLAAERPEHFPADVRDLMAWLTGVPLVDGHPFASVRAYPAGPTSPEVWILGSSTYGAQVAAHFGLPYCFAWFFTDGRGAEEAIALYQSSYRPSALHPKPHAGICVWALAADTAAEAERQLEPRLAWRAFRDRGVFRPIDPPEVAIEHAFSDAERARLDRMRRDALVGTGPEVARRIKALADRLAVQEVAIVTWAHDEAVRRTSYAILARAFALAGHASAA